MRIVSLLFVVALLGAGCAGSQPAATSVPAAPTSDAGTATPTANAADQQAATGTADANTGTTASAPAAKKTAAPAKKPATVNVTITDTAFEPQIMAVSIGTTVVWTNKGTKSQTVRAEAAILFDSGNISPGTKYSHAFKAAGTYPYYSASHPELKGTIIVR